MALITTIDQLKQYLPVEKSTFPSTFIPDVERAEEIYIKKITGQGVYDLIATGSPTADALALLSKVRAALAPLAYQLLVPKLNVRVSDKGIHTSESTDKERAMKWMVDDLRNQLLIDGYNALDRLLEYMESKTTDDWYATWAASSEFASYKQYFLNKASVFQQHVNINGNRWLFAQMFPLIGNTETFFIEPAIGETFTATLKAKHLDNSGTTDEKNAIAKIQQCCALFVYSKALRDPNFLNELIVVTATRSDDIRKQENSLAHYFRLADDYENMAQGMLNKLRAFLNANASPTVFADFYESDLYQDPEEQGSVSNFRKRSNNDSSETSFFF